MLAIWRPYLLDQEAHDTAVLFRMDSFFLPCHALSKAITKKASSQRRLLTGNGCPCFRLWSCQEGCAATLRFSQYAVHNDDHAGSGPCGPLRKARSLLTASSPDDVDPDTNGTNGQRFRDPLAEDNSGPYESWH